MRPARGRKLTHAELSERAVDGILFGSRRLRETSNIKIVFKNLYSCDLEHRSFMGPCEYGEEYFGSIQCEQSLN
jgi:hypothetical protein